MSYTTFDNNSSSELHLDEFIGELVRRLIADEGMQELDNNDANHDPHSPQQQRYNVFYNTWSSWNLLYDELKKQGRLK